MSVRWLVGVGLLCAWLVGQSCPSWAENGPPPPPADNEIPPPPPKLNLGKKKRSPRGSQQRSYKNNRATHSARKQRRYRRYRRFRRPSNAWKKLRFWWSSETGMYLASYSVRGRTSDSSLDFMGLQAVGRVGLGWRSWILTLGAATSFSFSDPESDGGLTFGNTSVTMIRLSGSLGWAMGRYIVLEAGMGMEYLELLRGSFRTESLLFPFHTGVTIRIPVRQRAFGIRALTSFAFDQNTDGFYFSVTLNLVYQTL